MKELRNKSLTALEFLDHLADKVNNMSQEELNALWKRLKKGRKDFKPDPEERLSLKQFELERERFNMESSRFSKIKRKFINDWLQKGPYTVEPYEPKAPIGCRKFVVMCNGKGVCWAPKQTCRSVAAFRNAKYHEENV
jgi:hypothetical protein